MSPSKYTIKISKGKIILLVIVAVFVGYLAYNSNDIRNNPDYEGSFAYASPKGYLNLFPDSVRRRFTDPVTFYGKFHDSITMFNYDSKKYFINVFKIEFKDDLPLNKSLSVSTINDLQINGIAYLMAGGRNFDINYRPRRGQVSHLHLSLFGGPIKTVAFNDTIACFYSDFKIFSIKYNLSDNSDIWGMAQGKFPNEPEYALPISIMFVKKNKILYFLVMSVNSKETKVDPNQLYHLIYPK